jgi:hypothetical protein
MRHHHHHGDLRGWIVGGIGLALGYLVFHFVWTAVALVGMLVWYSTDNWKTAWRRGARALFILAMSLTLLVGLVILLSD